jgi:lipopolysaccharide export system ATP-binding protein
MLSIEDENRESGVDSETSADRGFEPATEAADTRASVIVPGSYAENVPAPENGRKTLEARDVVKTYRGRNVVNHVTVYVRTGETVGLLGPNGAGKTTTFYMTIGLVTPNGGKIFLNGHDITRVPIYKRARMGIGYLSQESSVFKKLTVEENILLVWESIGMPVREQKRKLDELLVEFNIEQIRKSKAYVLSGGERRRTEVARALAGNPDFLLLDEPFTGIDPITIESLKDIISHLREKGLGVLVTDHNVRETLDICDRAYVLLDGQVLVEGTPQEIAENELARKYFLGERFKLDTFDSERVKKIIEEEAAGGG